VPGPDFLSLVHLPGALLAYSGLGPGQELIPYFLALLALLATALSAVVRWPFAVLARLFSRFRRPRSDDGTSPPITANVPESADDGQHDKP
jgi:hypothetical protein